MPCLQFCDVLLDFNSSDFSGFSCAQYSTVQVMQKVESGCIKCFNGQSVGVLPKSVIGTPTKVEINSNERLFKSISYFTDTIEGDLPFQTGDLIVGHTAVNDEWWTGTCNNKTGIFPLTLVEEVPYSLDGGVTRYEPITTAEKTSNQNQTVSTDCGDDPVLYTALVTSSAQLDEELSFTAGDIIQVIKNVDADWLEGSCHGQTGVFLSCMAEPLDPSTLPHQQSTTEPRSEIQNNIPSQTTQINFSERLNSKPEQPSLPEPEPEPEPNQPEVITQAVPISVEPYAVKALFEFKAISGSELSLHVGDIITVTEHVDEEWARGSCQGHDGRFPLNFVERSDEVTAMVQAMVLYNFDARYTGEVGVTAGEIVQLFGTLDPTSEWTKLKTAAGDIGHCPSGFLDEVTENDIALYSSTSKPKQTNGRNILNTQTSESKPKKPPPPQTQDATLTVTMRNHQTTSRPLTMIESKPKSQPPARPASLHMTGSTTNIITQSSIPNNECTLRTNPELTPITSPPRPTLPSPPRPTAPPPTLSPERPKNTPPSRPQALPASKSVDVPIPVHIVEQPPEETVQEDNTQSSNEDDIQENGIAESGPEYVTEEPVKPVVTLPRVPSRPAPPPPIQKKNSSSLLKVDRETQLYEEMPADQSSMSEHPKQPGRTRPVESRPLSVMPFELDESDLLIMEDLKQRIQTLQNDIDILYERFTNYNTEIENLDGLNEDQSELDSKLEFYMENINGMTIEMQQLQDELDECTQRSFSSSQQDVASSELKIAEQNSIDSIDRIAKRKEKRTRIISEIVETEESYLKDLQFCMEAFLQSDVEPPPEMDMETLFGNMEDVISVSNKFLSILKQSVDNTDFQYQIIGRPFVDIVDDMKGSYAPYCRNHDDVCELLEQYSSDEVVKGFIRSRLDYLRTKTTVFTLGAFLIKPVQRVLKYPLLLRELNENTESDHVDKSYLSSAMIAQNELATHINEYKRRKDLVYKYRTYKDDTLTDKMSRFTIHSIRKKSNRFSMKLTGSMGLANQTVDKEFEQSLDKFRNLERTARSLLRNITDLLTYLQSTLANGENIASDLSDYFEHQFKEVDQYLSAQEKITKHGYTNFKSLIEDNVLTVLRQTQTLFISPGNLIEKRDDKRLDYDSCKYYVEKTKDIDRAKLAREECQRARQNFEALNIQLKDELPIFNKAVEKLLRYSLIYFIETYKKYQSDSLKLLYPLLQHKELIVRDPDLVREFESENDCQKTLFSSPLLNTELNMTSLAPTHSTLSNKLSTGSAGSNSGGQRSSTSPRPVSPRSGVKESQSNEIINKLRNTYQPSQLYTLTRDIQTKDPMELCARNGDLVAVLVQKDPMGNKDRWFVDNGARKGFMNKKLLKEFAQEHTVNIHTTQGDMSQLAYPSGNTGGNVTHPAGGHVTQSMNDVDHQASSTANQQQTNEYEVWVAMYPYASRSPREVSISVDQLIYVYNKYDESGSTDWWYAQTCDGFGYVPANYLRTQNG